MRAALCILVSLTGCVAEMDAGDDAIGEAPGALTSDNALNFNALNFNALNFNALNFNALNFNAVDPGALATLQDPGASGDLARQLMRYLVSCALGRTQSFQFQWTDATGKVHDESYPGQLGLAPSWASGALNANGQRLVSACLAARANYYQVQVLISARSEQAPLRTVVRSEELDDYPNVEGAFWGNLFGSQPFLNACYHAPRVSNSRAWKRDCAAGHLTASGDIEECGIIHIVGDCRDVCDNLYSQGGYYPACVERPEAGGGKTKQVITTALP